MNSFYLDELKVEDTTHISDELERYFSDIVFTCPYGETKIELCLLLEHKSMVVPYPHLQLLRYMLEKWQVDVANKRSLQAILPIILYHGKRKWKVRPFSAYFEGIDANLLAFMPSFDYHLTDLNSYTDEQILMIKAGFLLNSFMVLKHIKDNDALRKNFNIYFQATVYDAQSRQKLGIIFRFLMKNSDIADDELPSLMKDLNDKLKADFMSTYEMLIQRGKEQGLQQGLKEGELKKATIAILNLHAESFSISFIAKILAVEEAFVKKVIDTNTKAKTN